MTLQIGVHRRGLEHGVVIEALEQLQQPLWRLLRCFEVADGCPVGGLLLAALIREHGALGHLLAAHGHAHAAGARLADAGAAAADRCRAAQDHCRSRQDLGVLQLLAQPHEMPSGDMAALVREDADDLVRGLGVDQRSGVHEDVLAVRHEGIERPLADQHDLDGAGAQACRLGDRLQIVAHQLLDLGIADDRRPLGLRNGRNRRDRKTHAEGRGECRTAKPWSKNP